MDEDRARKQLNVRITPIAKRRLIRGAAFEGRSMTNLVEGAAAGLEALALKRLSAEERVQYLAKEIQPIRPRKPGASEAKVVVWTTLSMQLTVRAKRQLHRYANYAGFSISEVLRCFAKNVELSHLKKLNKEQRGEYLAGTLNPALFFQLWPEGEMTNPDDEEAA